VPLQQYGIDKTNLTLTFQEPFLNSYILKPSEVAAMKLYSAGDVNANEENKSAYRTFRASQKGLNVLVEHEVLVASSKEDAKRVHVGRTKKMFTRNVHLLDISVRVLASCGGINYSNNRDLDVLASNKYALLIAYNMAVALRQMITGREVYRCGDLVVRFTRHPNDDMEEIDDGVLTDLLQLLHPSATDMAKVFKGNIGAVPNKYFEKNHLDLTSEVTGSEMAVQPNKRNEDSLGV